jgi:hypothetical protein
LSAPSKYLYYPINIGQKIYASARIGRISMAESRVVSYRVKGQWTVEEVTWNSDATLVTLRFVEGDFIVSRTFNLKDLCHRVELP